MDESPEGAGEPAPSARPERINCDAMIGMIVYLQEEAARLGVADAATLLGAAALAIQEHIARRDLKPVARTGPRLVT
jgi:hypothetical protein